MLRRGFLLRNKSETKHQVCHSKTGQDGVRANDSLLDFERSNHYPLPHESMIILSDQLIERDTSQSEIRCMDSSVDDKARGAACHHIVSTEFDADEGKRPFLRRKVILDEELKEDKVELSQANLSNVKAEILESAEQYSPHRERSSDGETGESLRSIHMELAELLYQIRRCKSRRKRNDSARSFVVRLKDFQQGIHITVWNQLLDGLFHSTGSSPPELCLGLTLLENMTESVVPIARIALNKESPQRLLSLLTLLDVAFDNVATSQLQLSSASTTILPLLLQIADRPMPSKTRRSVLGQRAWMLSIKVISKVVSCDSNSPHNIDASIIAAHLLELCENEVNRLNGCISELGRQSRGDTFTQNKQLEMSLLQCRRAIVLDWKELSLKPQCFADESSAIVQCDDVCDHSDGSWIRHVIGLELRGVRIGGLAQTMILSDSSLTASDFKSDMEMVPDTPSTKGLSTSTTDQRMLLRGVAAWLCNIRRGRDEDRAQIPNILAGLDLIGSMCVKLMFCSWCVLFDFVAILPQKIIAVMPDTLESGDKFFDLYIKETLAVLVNQGGKPALRVAFERIEVSPPLVDTLMSVAKIGLVSTGCAPRSPSLLGEICRFLIEGLAKHRCIQDRIDDLLYLCSGCTDDYVINKACRLLSFRSDSLNKSDPILLHACVKFVGRSDDGMFARLKVFIRSIEQLCSSHAEANSGSTDVATDKICSYLSQIWYRTIEGGSCEGGNLLGSALVAVARVFIEQPSNVVALKLFGCLSSCAIMSSNCNGKLSDASLEVFDFCIKVLTDLEGSAAPQNVFQRLAPLLLLRRFPFSHMRILYSQIESFRDWKRLGCLLDVLSSHLWKRLDLDNQAPMPIQYLQEERRLAAEIAGRMLPIENFPQLSFVSSDEGCQSSIRSCFLPIFRRLIKDKVNEKSFELCDTRRTRGCLYAACNLISSAHATESGGTVLSIAYFAIDLLRLDAGFLDAGICDEIRQLQAGCQEFFVQCNVRSLQFCDTDGTRIDSALGISFSSAVHQVSAELKMILRTGRAPNIWSNWHIEGSESNMNEKSFSFLDSTLMLLWETLQFVSIRCLSDQQTYSIFLLEYIPWLSDCVVSDSTHANSVSAALSLLISILEDERALQTIANCYEDKVSELYCWAIGMLSDDVFMSDPFAMCALQIEVWKLACYFLRAGLIQCDETELTVLLRVAANVIKSTPLNKIHDSCMDTLTSLSSGSKIKS